MLTQRDVESRQATAFQMFRDAGLFFKPDEKQRIEIADFGLGTFEQTGLAVYVYVNTDRCCAKDLAMWPRQTCPEHLHPSVGGQPGKEETFRVRHGKMWLYIPGPRADRPNAVPPRGREKTYTIWREIELNPGDQYTLTPDTPHWFQAGDEGCVVSEFSTRSTDENDIFTDPEIQRITKVAR